MSGTLSILQTVDVEFSNIFFCKSDCSNISNDQFDPLLLESPLMDVDIPIFIRIRCFSSSSRCIHILVMESNNASPSLFLSEILCCRHRCRFFDISAIANPLCFSLSCSALPSDVVANSSNLSALDVTPHSREDH